MRSKIAILASGEGTTAEATIIASLEKRVNYSVELIITNNKKAGIFARISNLNQKYDTNIKCLLATNDHEILHTLKEARPDLIVLMGYMKKIGPELVAKHGWQNHYTNPHQAMMLNTHPGPLPTTKGLYGIYVQQYILDNKLPCAAQTLHVVSENYDEGPIVAEHKVLINPNDTPEKLFERVKIAEKQYLPNDIEKFIEARHKILGSQK